MSDPNDELRRAVDLLRVAIERLEAKVVLEVVYRADKEAATDRYRNIEQRIEENKRDAAEDTARLEKKVDKDVEDRKTDRRLIIGAFLAFVAQLVMDVYQQAQGG